MGVRYSSLYSIDDKQTNRFMSHDRYFFVKMNEYERHLFKIKHNERHNHT